MKRPLLLVLAILLLAGCSKAVKPETPPPYDVAKDFEEANHLLSKKNYDEARSHFEDVKRRDTEMKYAPLAQLRIADSYVEEEEPELAVDEYQQFLDSYPSHKYAAYAQYQIGMAYYTQIKGPARGFGAAVRALGAFESLNRIYPRNPYRESVKFKIDRCRQVIADHEYMVGDFYYRQSAYSGAIGRLESLLRDFPAYNKAPEVLYRLAVSHKHLGEDQKAEQDLEMLKKRFPGHELIKKTEEALADIEKERGH
ncbi:MAG: outer membrane protein assembly factor BamD [Nitrospirota bacterium]|jgi:outer membrane protein assembly factor BamD